MGHVAVLVPGIMGSVLKYHEEVVWPGAGTELFLPYGKMAKLTRDDLVATDVIRSFLISDQYSDLIQDLGTCGFREDDDPPTLFICPYDWRKDNRLAANVLAQVVDTAVTKQSKEVEVSIIAHSMGGLISRYYLESGEYESQPGFRAVRQLITLGTPHRGSPLALSAALGEEKRLWLNEDQVLQIASDPRYPSLYQLLPPRGEPFAWDRNPGARYEPLDIYESAVSNALGLVATNLQAATDFHVKLDHTKRPPGVRYFTFVGTRQTMISYALLRKVNGKYQFTKVETEDSGDGTVPTWSGSISGVQGRPVGGEHGTIYKNDDLRRVLAGLLGKQGVLAAPPERVEVAVRERVTHPEEVIHVALTFPSGASSVEGDLRIERAQIDDTGKFSGYLNPSVHKIRYAGVTTEKISITFAAPVLQGLYRIGYYASGRDEPAGTDEFFVQKRE